MKLKGSGSDDGICHGQSLARLLAAGCNMGWAVQKRDVAVATGAQNELGCGNSGRSNSNLGELWLLAVLLM